MKPSRPDYKTLKPRQSKWRKLWSFANTSLGLWLLSTVAVGGISQLAIWQYGKYQLEQQRLQTIDRLDTEISSRLDLAGFGGRPLFGKDPKEWSKPTSPESIQAFFAQVLAPPSPERAIFPDYEKRGLVSLIKELSLHIRGAERRCLDKAIESIRNLSSPHVSERIKTIHGAVFRVHILVTYRENGRWGEIEKSSHPLHIYQPVIPKNRMEEAISSGRKGCDYYELQQ